MSSKHCATIPKLAELRKMFIPSIGNLSVVTHLIIYRIDPNAVKDPCGY